MGVIGGWVLWCGTTAGQGSCWLEILLEPASPMGNGRPNRPASVSPCLAEHWTQITDSPGKCSDYEYKTYSVLSLIYLQYMRD